ncbi:CheY-like chemotaxis protein [Bradyrhizobium liaoningense]
MANILIVGDDPALEITIRLLERGGPHVTAAGDGCR